MSEKHEKQSQEVVVADNASLASTDDDDRVLEEIGYIPSFKREFSSLATVRARTASPVGPCPHKPTDK